MTTQARGDGFWRTPGGGGTFMEIFCKFRVVQPKRALRRVTRDARHGRPLRQDKTHRLRDGNEEREEKVVGDYILSDVGTDYRDVGACPDWPG